MNHKYIHTRKSICSRSENPIKTLRGQAQLNKSTIEIWFGTFDAHTSFHIHLIKLSSYALQVSISNCTLWTRYKAFFFFFWGGRYKALYLQSYSWLQVDTPTANQSLCYFKILEDLLLPMWFQQRLRKLIIWCVCVFFFFFDL